MKFTPIAAKKFGKMSIGFICSANLSVGKRIESECKIQKKVAPKVVNVKVKHIRPKYQNLREWSNATDNLYIGRSGVVFIDGARYPKTNSKWANPFSIKEFGTREVVLEKYRSYIEKKIENKEVDLDELRGKTLGCWCKPDGCHGDILLELVRGDEIEAKQKLRKYWMVDQLKDYVEDAKMWTPVEYDENFGPFLVPGEIQNMIEFFDDRDTFGPWLEDPKY